jgi:signal transduction histidine kinase
MLDPNKENAEKDESSMTAEETRMLKHELRTPINHIIGYSELLLEAADDEGENGVSERAKAIHKNGQTLASLVDGQFANFRGSPELVSAALRPSVTPVIAAILENSGSEFGDAPIWSQDFRRIEAATQKFMTILALQPKVISK